MKIIALPLILCFLALVETSLSAIVPSTYNGELPHQVSIQFNRRHVCGGALISRKHVLSAAHCYYQLITGIPIDPFQPMQNLPPLSDVTVEVGSVVIGLGQTHAVQSISIHGGYSPRDLNLFPTNDVAVVTLSSPIVESAYVRPIGLPYSMSEVAIGSTAVMSGFGNSYYTGPQSAYLQKIAVFIMSQQDCSFYLMNHPNTRRAVSSSHICAYGGVGYSACYGDSGGALIQDNKVVGIVSGGVGQCGSGYPDVYTKVSHFMDFIQNEMQKDQAQVQAQYTNNYYSNGYYDGDDNYYFY